MSGRDRKPPPTAESARCAELLRRMTLAEKIAQLCAVWVTDLLEDGRFSKEKAGKHLAEGIGQVSRVAGVSGLPVREAAAVADAIQDYLRHNTRLGVPAILHEECLCGFQARGTTSFPQAIGLASAWNPDLVERIGAAIRKEMRAVGTHQALGPVLDLVRDPRWGRCEETFGEDPYLAACMGLAAVRGLQGDDLRTGIGGTLKHFVAHGSSEGGRNEAPVSAGPRELRDCFMVPFERVVKETEVLSVMNAYHDIDGIPCAGSPELLTWILREEWGFGGIVVSDYEAVDQLRRMHFTAADKAEAARQALEAGIDVELPSADCFGEPLASAVNSGRVSVELIDRAAMRVLAAKERLGLLDAAPSRQPSADLSVIDSASHRSLSRRAAGESLVLLKNDGVLPLSRKLSSLAVIGPNAHSVRNLLGDYAFEAAYGVPVGLSEGTSILKGLEDIAGPGTRLNFSPGCDIGSEDSSGIEPAVRAAERSDAVVLVVYCAVIRSMAIPPGKGGTARSWAFPGCRSNSSVNLPLPVNPWCWSLWTAGRWRWEMSKSMRRPYSGAGFPGSRGEGRLPGRCLARSIPRAACRSLCLVKRARFRCTTTATPLLPSGTISSVPTAPSFHSATA